MLAWSSSDQRLDLRVPWSGTFSLQGGGRRDFQTRYHNYSFFGWTVLVSDVPVLVWGAQHAPHEELRNQDFVAFATAGVPVECSDPEEYAAFEIPCVLYDSIESFRR